MGARGEQVRRPRLSARRTVRSGQLLSVPDSLGSRGEDKQEVRLPKQAGRPVGGRCPNPVEMGEGERGSAGGGGGGAGERDLQSKETEGQANSSCHSGASVCQACASVCQACTKLWSLYTRRVNTTGRSVTVAGLRGRGSHTLRGGGMGDLEGVSVQQPQSRASHRPGRQAAWGGRWSWGTHRGSGQLVLCLVRSRS